jgi:hypothetical protein
MPMDHGKGKGEGEGEGGGRGGEGEARTGRCSQRAQVLVRDIMFSALISRGVFGMPENALLTKKRR